MANKESKQEERKTTQLTKTKPPPFWVGQDYEKYAVEVEAWNKPTEMMTIPNIPT
jgi:hypothetical protein